MSILTKRSVHTCPQCGAGFYAKAGILADDQLSRCPNCGSMLFVELHFGKVKSVSCVQSTSEMYKGYGGISTTSSVQEPVEARADTKWEREDNAWWMEKWGYVPGMRED